MDTLKKFRIDKQVVVITGGAGLFGTKHAEAVIEGGGIPILLDVNKEAIEFKIREIKKKYDEPLEIQGYECDITDKNNIKSVAGSIMDKYGHIDILINNAANNPKVENKSENMNATKFEEFPLDIWMKDIAVGLTGAFLMSQVIGKYMAVKKKGVILNISSDLGIIAPDQRIYKNIGENEDTQTYKPVTYSVIKHGLIGLTKYLATYYSSVGIRANAICPGGIYNGQDDAFVERLTNLIPLGRMADKDEYKSTILYLISDASSYMTGSTVIVDGGRTCW